MNRTLMVGVFVVALLATTGAARSHFRRVTAAEDFAIAANVWMGMLTPEQRAKAALPFESPTRVDWHFIPKPERKGVQIREMTPPQRQAALRLLRVALSETGFAKAQRIMAMESLILELERKKPSPNLRDSERYFFTLFGAPTPEGRWGVSIEGHHLSLNFVCDRGRVVAATPTAMAANPATVKNEAHPDFPVGTQVLKDEEQLAFALLAALTPEQRAKAVIAKDAPAEIRGAGAAQPPQEPAVGLPVSGMSPEQVGMLRALLEAYTNSMASEVAAQRWADMEAAGMGTLHFAWAGADVAGVGHYYRVQGPTMLVEFVNVQPDAAGNPANHIHCVWRDMRGDFGLRVGG